MKTVYLLTGRPGTGKTSLVRQAVAELKGKAGGFYTEEIRVQGTRLGFKLITLDGQEAVLAHVDFHSRYRVGKYDVDIDSLNKVGVPVLEEAIGQRDVIVIDEIGKMELFSNRFREVVLEAIQSGKRVLGTIMLKPDPWADDIKRQPQVKLVEVTRTDYYRVLADIKSWVKDGV
ncbi:MAG: NTPase [Chloroflexi bacterium]|nr:NTPase [Chloroflexota bacterium]